MNNFSSIIDNIYYYVSPSNIKIIEHYDYSIVDNKEIQEETEKLYPTNYEDKVEIFTIPSESHNESHNDEPPNVSFDINSYPPKNFTPDSTSTLDIHVDNISQESEQEHKNDKFKEKSIEEIIEYYENKIKDERLYTNNVYKELKIIEHKCDIIFLLFILHIMMLKYESA